MYSSPYSFYRSCVERYCGILWPSYYPNERRKPMSAKAKPSRLTDGQMKKVGVTITSKHNTALRCDSCGSVWSPNIQPGGRLPSGYWKCPNGCNQ